MSPEQVTGAPVDGRTDLFALGVLLYEALSGARPFLGRNAGEVFARIRDGEYVPLHKVAPHVPRPLVDIVKRALAVRPNDRFPNAAAMRRELEGFLAQRVGMSYEALLVGFLRHRNKLTETEALAHLTQAELRVVDDFEDPRRARAWTRWLVAFLVVAAGLGTGLVLTQSYWMGLVRQLTVR
jgi:serine/threonine-protein kinase